MKADRYTRVMLTIIAAALVMLTFQNIFEAKTATAAGGIVKVSICDINGRVCADVNPIQKKDFAGNPYDDGRAVHTY
jgi:hypothetical protein